MAQDDSREKAVIRHFGLKEYSNTNRGNQYWPDAKIDVDGLEYALELKSKPEYVKQKGILKKKSDLSTARDFGPEKVKEWEEKVDVFLFSESEDRDFNGFFTEHYALTFEDLYPWLDDKVIKRVRNGSKTFYPMGKFYEEIIPFLKENKESICETDEGLDRLIRTMKKGTSLNDPKIPWKFIRDNGTLIKDRNDLINFIREKFNGENKQTA
tara:strand:- start:481 stop:1113 length:633 start_codon:yes stop_codon:yes gene_type:complete